MKTKYYIAYGSNMDEKQMAYRCPDAELVGTSEIRDYELIFKGSQTGAYATIEKKKGSRVPVLIWKITESDEKSLDRYEGFPNFYYKKDLGITINGEQLTAMVYIMHENRKFGVPSNAYFNILDSAYWKFGFDYDILETAYNKCWKAVYGNDKS